MADNSHSVLARYPFLVYLHMEASAVLEEIKPDLNEADLSYETSVEDSSQQLKAQISQLAEHLHVTGHNEAAHFVDIAVLALRDLD
ncbi:MAG: hypothetical protein HOM62_14710 [Rhodospirillaceae bacterium]|jgi:hypothetical protein|nr:hypothetical protein [Rhodospirillaceae bacterium]MBT5081819.1 hypothetical protein [Rhodospirillaceae bacterium]MBT5881408.1 hypothetical protein [Rhodospirillaceae bacterium]MBT6911327.1 hypothetical protein [Rhodospirillaceae bacterium]